MTMAAPVTPWKRARERGYPAIIAHKGGNGTRDFTAAVDAGADLVETDLWVHRGRFEARHERALYPIPLLYESRRLKRRPGRFDLAAAVEALGGRAELFLDLKNGPGTASPLIAEALERLPAGTRLAASSPSWHILREVIVTHESEILKFISAPVQTNEVRRSAVLLGGFLDAATRYRLPLSLYELGET